jgi:hypothetical protein
MPAKDHMLSAVCEQGLGEPARSCPQAGLLALSDHIWQAT